MIAAGVKSKALSTYMGHANISITLDTFGHLMPGSEDGAAGLLDACLTAEKERSDKQARSATGELTGEPEANGSEIPLWAGGIAEKSPRIYYIQPAVDQDARKALFGL